MIFGGGGLKCMGDSRLRGNDGRRGWGIPAFAGMTEEGDGGIPAFAGMT